MRKREMSKKLELKKETVTDLTKMEQYEIKGGYWMSYVQRCPPTEKRTCESCYVTNCC